MGFVCIKVKLFQLTFEEQHIILNVLLISALLQLSIRTQSVSSLVTPSMEILQTHFDI
jgi:hypothetical protein